MLPLRLAMAALLVPSGKSPVDAGRVRRDLEAACVFGWTGNSSEHSSAAMLVGFGSMLALSGEGSLIGLSVRGFGLMSLCSTTSEKLRVFLGPGPFLRLGLDKMELADAAAFNGFGFGNGSKATWAI